MTFEYRDADGGHLSVTPLPGVPYVLVRTDPEGCAVPADLMPDAIAGIRDAARTASGQQPKPAAAYSDGKGRAYCLTCAATTGADVPLAIDHIDPHEACAHCQQYVADVARQTTGQDDTKPVDPTAAIEVWARMLNAADTHVYGPEHSHWRDLPPNLQDQYRKAATWLIPRLTIQALPTPAKHRPPCTDGDYCGEASHCPPLASTGRDDTEPEDPEPSAVNPACTNRNAHAVACEQCGAPWSDSHGAHAGDPCKPIHGFQQTADNCCGTNDPEFCGHVTCTVVGQPAEAQATDYDRDPEAIAWARRKIQDEIDRCRKFHTSALEAGKPEQAEMWNRLANRMQRTFMGGSGCVHAYFDERLPALRRAADTVEDER